MKQFLLYFFVLLYYSASTQQSKKSTICFYTSLGLNYGIKNEKIFNSEYKIKTKLTPQGSLGIRKSNKKYNRLLDVQIGVASANDFLNKNNENILLGSGPSEIGAGKGIHTFMLLKLNGLQTFDLIKNMKYNLKGIVGAGLQYIPVISTNVEEVNNQINYNYFTAYILYDFKYVKNGNNYTPTLSQRPVSINAYTGLQYFPSKKILKNFGLEVYWNPSITPVINGSYDVNINFANYSSDNINQMLHSFGIKVLYQFFIY